MPCSSYASAVRQGKIELRKQLGWSPGFRSHLFRIRWSLSYSIIMDYFLCQHTCCLFMPEDKEYGSLFWVCPVPDARRYKHTCSRLQFMAGIIWLDDNLALIVKEKLVIIVNIPFAFTFAYHSAKHRVAHIHNIKGAPGWFQFVYFQPWFSIPGI